MQQASLKPLRDPSASGQQPVQGQPGGGADILLAAPAWEPAAAAPQGGQDFAQRQLLLLGLDEDVAQTLRADRKSVV